MPHLGKPESWRFLVGCGEETTPRAQQQVSSYSRAGVVAFSGVSQTQANIVVSLVWPFLTCPCTGRYPLPHERFRYT
jgi:hypothetical protein